MPLRLRLAPLPALALLALGQVPAAEAPAAKPPSPKLVTLQAEKLPLGKALDELARQTGVRVEDRRGGPEPALRLDLKDATFWRALDAVADAAGARVDLYASGARVALARRPAGYHNPPTCYDGVFRLSLRRVALAEDLETRKALCTLTLEVAWEPNLMPLFLETKPQGLRLLDAGGKPLPAADEGSSLAYVEGDTSQSVDFTVLAPPRSQPRIGLVEGRLTAVAPSKMLTFPFDTLDRLAKDGEARRQTQEGVVCRVDRPKLTRDRWTVRVTLTFPPGGKKLDSNQAQSAMASNRLTLVSADGKRRLPSTSYVVEAVTPRRAVISYHFTPRGGMARYKPEDWKPVYRTAAQIVDVPIKFSFRDVPLP